RRVGTAERVRRRELLDPVLPEQDLPGLGVHELRIRGRGSALHVEHDRLVCGPYALRVGGEGNKTCPLVLGKAGDLEARPALVALGLGEKVRRGDRTADV